MRCPSRRYLRDSSRKHVRYEWPGTTSVAARLSGATKQLGLDVVPHVAAGWAHQRSRKIWFVSQKRLFQQYLPTAVRETEALWRALINLVPEPADAPERQSFELLRNDCLCEQRD
jgi:hypothetical protein